MTFLFAFRSNCVLITYRFRIAHA